MAIIDESILENILPYVQKPGRYIGEEINSVKKKWRTQLKTVLCYPDTYEVGMSNYSLRILYEMINNEKDLLAERTFLPYPDMQDIMQKEKISLFSLESRYIINDFDILGFTIQYELNYLPLLQILKLADIPLYTHQREEGPIIMAGGAGLANPDPIADFIDFFLIGEADNVLIPLLKEIRRYKNDRLSKKQILEKLNKNNCIYVPALGSKKVERNIVPDLNKVFHPQKQIVPLIDIVQNRGIIEIDRGCVNNCRFCQAGYYYRPKRERSLSCVLKLTETLIKNTGYNTITLLSLSISNYSCINQLLKTLNSKYQNKGISFSLPSIRIDHFTLDLLEQIDIVRKSGLTFAIETAVDEIQNMINKPIDMANFLNTLVVVAKNRWKTVKFYFMIGFRQDNQEIDAIKTLMDQIITRLKQERLHLNINLHITTFTKKPLTPFCYEPQIDYSIIQEKYEQLKNHFFNKYYKRWIKLKGQNIDFSFLDAILSRADRKVSKVLYDLNKIGYYYDTFEEKFDIDLWLKTFKKNKIDFKKYIYDQEYAQTLADSFKTNFGYHNNFFKEEYIKTKKQESTENCIKGNCYECGICHDHIRNNLSPSKEITIKERKTDLPLQRFKYIIIFKKQNLLKYISHRNLWDVFEHIFRMVNMPIVYSQGFNKRMRFSFIFTPPFMVEGENELLEFITYKKIDEKELVRKINTVLINKDFKAKKIKSSPLIKTSLNASLKHSEYKVETNSKTYSTKIKAGIKNHNHEKTEQSNDRTLLITLAKDQSITKLISQILHEEFPGLWKHIKQITRKKIY